MDLAYTCLRDGGRGDFLLGQLMARPLQDDLAHSLLLVALSRLERRPDDGHTIVNQAVDAAAKIHAGSYKAVVNGVLRNFLRRRDELLTQADADPVAHFRHPDWWIERIRRDHPEHWTEILLAGNTHPPMCLRVNPRRPAAADFSAIMASNGLACRRLAPNSFLLERPVPVDQIPDFAAGSCSVQDFGAQTAAQLLDIHPGQRVLDACAAPGGKAAHLLELADIDLTALDVDASRVARIGENLKRLGLAATITTGNARLPKRWWDGRAFDRILADVPCSASGVVRRHPDAKWLRRETDIAGFASQQAAIIDALWQTLVEGGKMLYATCSLFAEENEDQIEKFIARHSDACRLPTRLPSSVTATTTPTTSTAAASLDLKLLPTAEHDGFYYALLQKKR